MIIDISSNNGAIDWQKVSKAGVTDVILRSTTRNGQLDTRTIENYNGILKNMNEVLNSLSFYKFSYVRTYAEARIECLKTLNELFSHGIRRDVISRFYLDIEAWGGRDYTNIECNEVILGYLDQCINSGVQFGLYFNYNYAKNIVDKVWSDLPLWIARYNTKLGDIAPWNPEIWQYTSSGHVDGISTNVDISRKVKE